MKTIIEMAREAGFMMESSAAIQAAACFAELVRADERARRAEQPAQDDPDLQDKDPALVEQHYKKVVVGVRNVFDAKRNQHKHRPCVEVEVEKVWMDGGKMIAKIKENSEPTYTFKPPSEPVLMLRDTNPNYNITYYRDGEQVGVLDFNGPEVTFTGDAEESAKLFFDLIARAFKGRLEQERADEREQIIDLVAMYGGPVDLEAAIRARGNT